MAHYHFIGIGGTGLSAIARVLFERGEMVSGSDITNSQIAKELKELGMDIQIGHKKNNIKNPDIVIRSSAIGDTNPEVIAARNKNIPVLKRRDFLGQLTKNQKVIAISGTHGKTTTTAMTSWMLYECEFDPSYVIGSISKNLGRNASAGDGDYFVIEADEYDNMFLGLLPDILVITNIEHDHPDCFPTEKDYLSAFHQLTKRIIPGGYLIACADNAGVKNLLNTLAEKVEVITYGSSKHADLQIIALNHITGKGIRFKIRNNTNRLDLPEKVEISLMVPGNHNACNATAALAIGAILKAETSKAINALSSFTGTGRRFDIIGNANGITFIDDYGHHPTEIKTTLTATRNQYPDKNIWAVWQPHTYSRTQELFDAFVNSFSECDHIIVTEIYRSREPQQAYSSKILVNALSHPDKHYIKTLSETERYLKKNLSCGDILIIFSAGDANRISKNLLNWFNTNGSSHD